MRGKAPARTVLSLQHGITPAYAGKSIFGILQFRFEWDHPRLCGEKSAFSSTSLRSWGSPPPMRGKAAWSMDSQGNIVDHPRLCGEKFMPCDFAPGLSGSPPPMRGKAPDASPTQILRRITPAYAGKSWIPITQFFNIQDHPRLCGEKSGEMLDLLSYDGSPPPMRGKAASQTFQTSSFRITPAYAGKSS